MTTIYYVENRGTGLEQTQKCGKFKFLFCIQGKNILFAETSGKYLANIFGNLLQNDINLNSKTISLYIYIYIICIYVY